MAKEKIEKPRQGFETVSLVKDYQTSLINLLGYTHSKSNRVQVSEIYKNEINRLENLFMGLKAQEERLFAKWGLKSYKELSDALDKWNSCGVESFINNCDGFYPKYRELKDRLEAESFTKKVAPKITSDPEIITIATTEGVDTIEEVARQLINNLNAKGKQKEVKFRTFKKGLAKVGGANFSDKDILGLLRYVTIIKAENGKATFSFSEDIPSRYRQKLKKIYKDEMDNEKTDISDDLKKEIKEIVLRGINGDAREFIEYELNRFNSYDINETGAMIKGFLGEIYWTAFFRYLTKKRITVVPTGLEKTTAGKQVPIDILLEELGFQVKNYRIKEDGTTTFKKKMSLLGFVQERLGLSEEAFQNFYISWGYNKVITEDTPTGSITYTKEYVEKHYKPLFDRFEQIISQAAAGGLEKIATARIDRILKLDDEFDFESKETNELVKEIDGVRANVLYLIGPNLVFSSDIVRAVLRLLKNRQAKVKFNNFSFSYKEPTASSVWPNPNSQAARNLMAGNIIDYEIQIEVGSLFQELQKKMDQKRT